MTCQRKYWHKKVNKSPKDEDIEDDTLALRVGKAFHQVLENTKHNLDGITYGQFEDWVAEFDVEPEHPMIFAMLKKYKEVHKKSGLRVLLCEIEVATESFLGYIDAIMEDEDRGWWIGDNKTSSSFSSSLLPTLPLHPQLNLYAFHANEVAAAHDLDPEKFRGCRYRLTTKSRLVRKDDEEIMSFMERLSKSIKSMDIVLPKEIMDPWAVNRVHDSAWKYIKKHKAEKFYQPNYEQCMKYYKPCAFYSKCNGRAFTSDEVKLEIIQ
jgi:hypothetical protein